MEFVSKINEKNPLVSVIVICHKHNKYVITALESIINQSYSNIQLIVINNVKDDCEKLIRDWIATNSFSNEPLFIQNESVLGLCKNINLGLGYVNGLYFQALSADDVLVKDKISEQVSLLQKLDNKCAGVYSDMLFIDESGIETGKFFFDILSDKQKIKADPMKFLLRSGKTIPAPTLLLKTEIIRNIGGYQEDWPIEDWPLYLLLGKQGYYLKIVDKPLVLYRLLPDGLGRLQNLKIILFCISLFENNLWLYDKNDEHQASKWFSFVCRVSLFDVRKSIRKFKFFLSQNDRKFYYSVRYLIFLFKMAINFFKVKTPKG